MFADFFFAGVLKHRLNLIFLSQSHHDDMRDMKNSGKRGDESLPNDEKLCRSKKEKRITNTTDEYDLRLLKTIPCNVEIVKWQIKKFLSWKCQELIFQFISYFFFGCANEWKQVKRCDESEEDEKIDFLQLLPPDASRLALLSFSLHLNSLLLLETRRKVLWVWSSVIIVQVVRSRRFLEYLFIQHNSEQV